MVVSLVYPVIPLRDIVLFPSITMPVFMGRARSLRALSEAKDRTLFAVAQRDGKADSPEPSELYQIGTIVKVLDQSALEGGSLRVVMVGCARGRARRYMDRGDYLSAEVNVLEDPSCEAAVVEQRLGVIAEIFKRMIQGDDPLVRVAHMQQVLELPELSAADRLTRLSEALT